MTCRANAHVVASALLVMGAALLASAPAQASSGGASTPGSGASASTSSGSGASSSSQPSTSTGDVQPGNTPVSASGNGITVSTRASAMLRNGMQFEGTAPASDAGMIVEIERLGRQTQWTWAATAHGTVGANGSFHAFWPANHIGRFQMRAVLEQVGGNAARATAASPALTIVVYRPSIATIYGPGFYGSRTACGQKLRPGMIGVANRTLKCGTHVSIYYHGQTMVVPVIDRGPYANHADWDLTMATAKALGITGTVTLGAVSLPSHPSS